MTRAQALKAMALSASDPNLRRAALEAASKAENNSATLIQGRADSRAARTFLASLAEGKKVTPETLAEMIDVTPSRAKDALDALTRSGEVVDGALVPAARNATLSSQKPGGNSLRQQQVQDAAVSQAAEAGAAEGRRVTSHGNKLINAKGLHGKALVGAIGQVQSGRATLTKSESEQLAVTRQEFDKLKATVQKFQEPRR